MGKTLEGTVIIGRRKERRLERKEIPPIINVLVLENGTKVSKLVGDLSFSEEEAILTSLSLDSDEIQDPDKLQHRLESFWKESLHKETARNVLLIRDDISEKAIKLVFQYLREKDRELQQKGTRQEEVLRLGLFTENQMRYRFPELSLDHLGIVGFYEDLYRNRTWLIKSLRHFLIVDSPEEFFDMELR